MRLAVFAATRTSMLIALLSVACLASEARALEPHSRPGMLFGFSVGGGQARLALNLPSGDRVRSNRHGGFAFGFRFGTMIRPDLAVGLEGTGWSRRYDELLGRRLLGTTVTLTSIGPAATFYPLASGFYVRGGLGLGSGRVSIEFLGLGADRNKYGLGYFGGTGYEFRVGESFAIGPAIEFGGTRLGTAVLGSESLTVDFDATYVNFAISASWYPRETDGKRR